MKASNNPEVYSDQLSTDSVYLEGIVREIKAITESSSIFKTMDIVPKLSLNARKNISKLTTFKSLEVNWDSYGAEVPSKQAINNAISFIRQADADGLYIYFVAPGPDGQVLVELTSNDREAEIYLNPDGDSEILIYEADNCLFEGTLDKDYDRLKESFSEKIEA